MKSKKPLSVVSVGPPLWKWNLPGPMFSRTEASKVTFTVSGDQLHVQAPGETIKKIAARLTLLGAKSEPPSPYGPWSEKTEGESR